MIWDFPSIVEALRSHLASQESALREEQAVYGLDSLDELRLHQLLATALSANYEVAREVHYPSSRGNKLSHRSRCDLVLTPKGHPLKRDSAPDTLFDPPDMTPSEEGLWLEVKAAFQYREAGRSHSGYGQQWRGGVIEDLRKMDADPLIHSAGLLLVVFTQSQEIVEKDLEIFEDDMIIKSVLAGFRQVAHIKILDRMGHTCCTAALWPTIQR